MGVSVQPDGLGSWLAGDAIKGMLSTITSWIDSGAAHALRLTGSMLSSTTSPGLLSSWFSTTYWRVAALAALLTVPFLFAAAVHSLVRSDLAMLGRAAFGYLPLAMIGVTIAGPLTTLLLAATDEMCGIVASAAGNDDGTALLRAADALADVTVATGDPMLGFFIGLLAVAATIGLWIELLIRAAAVDVIVLMLPIFFAAMVWPARRIWAIRAIETLVALILSKFAIVAVLTLGGAAFGGDSSGLSSSLVGATLILLAVLSPWALLRLLPLHEVAAAAAGGLSQAPRSFLRGAGGAVYDGLSATAADRGDGDGSAGLDAADDPDEASTRALAFGTGGLGGEGARMAGGGPGGTVDAAAGVAAAGGRATAAGSGATAAGSGAAAAGGGATAAGSGARAAGGGEPRFDAATTDGLRAVEQAGRRAAAGAGFGDFPGYGHVQAMTAFTPQPDDDRPPLNEAFGPGEWEGFVIGEEGDEVMAPPRFASGGAAPGAADTDVRPGAGAPARLDDERPSAANEQLSPPEAPTGSEAP